MTYKQVRDNFVQDLAENAYLNMCTTEEMELAISALEKQIPKKPIIRGLNLCKEISSISFVCPSCKQHIGRQRYCCYCGQALDWSETE